VKPDGQDAVLKAKDGGAKKSGPLMWNKKTVRESRFTAKLASKYPTIFRPNLTASPEEFYLYMRSNN